MDVSRGQRESWTGWKRVRREKEEEEAAGSIPSVYFNAIKYRCVQLKQRRVTRSRITRLECRYRFRERRKSKRIDPILFVDVDREREKGSLFIPWIVVIFSVSLIPSFESLHEGSGDCFSEEIWSLVSAAFRAGVEI